MKFFVWAVVVVFIVSLLVLTIRPHDNIELVYADDKSIIVYEVNISFLGTYRVKNEHNIEYPDSIVEYKNLTGKSAEVARAISKYKAEVVVCDEWILNELPESGLIDSSKIFIAPEDHNKMLVHQSDFRDLYYGMSINKNFKKIDLHKMEYMAFTGFAASMRERTAIKLIKDMTILKSTK